MVLGDRFARANHLAGVGNYKCLSSRVSYVAYRAVDEKKRVTTRKIQSRRAALMLETRHRRRHRRHRHKIKRINEKERIVREEGDCTDHLLLDPSVATSLDICIFKRARSPFAIPRARAYIVMKCCARICV